MEFPPEIVAHIRGFSEPVVGFWKVLIAAKKVGLREKRNLKVIQKLLVDAEAVHVLETLLQDIRNLQCCGAHLFVSKMSATVVSIEVWRPTWYPQTQAQLLIDEKQKAFTNELDIRIKARMYDPLYFKFVCAAELGSYKFEYEE